MKADNLIFGIQPILEALRSEKNFDRIVIQREIAHNDQFNEILSLAKERDVVISKVPLERINRITRKNHQGIAAFISLVPYAQVEVVLPGIYEQGQEPLILVLDRITDVRNFGAICRSAEGAGVHAIVIPSKGAAQINSDALKTSSGALNYLPICREDDLVQTLLYLKQSGLAIIACTEKTTQNLYDTKFDQPVAILMGSEDDGISEHLLKLADQKVSIPMKGQVSSLNVSVATGVILYEVLRQRI
jgi:23S rRNA (guanosine2251-2'-O)-methyltransferase